MGRIKLDREVFGLSALVERALHVPIKDLFLEEDTYYVVVNVSHIGKALGKGGMNVKQLQQQLGKNVRVVGFHDEVCEFVRNFISPLSVEEIIVQEGVVILRDGHRNIKSKLIGRGGKNLLILKRAVSRFFPVDVRVE